MSEERMPRFPMFVDLTDKRVVVVGAGTIAKRRIRILTSFSRNITVIAPEVNRELAALEQAGKIRILRRRYEREDLFEADLVIAASSKAAENNDIHAACKCLGIPVNVFSDRSKCDFFFPGIVHRDGLVAGVSGQGRDAKRVNALLEKISALLRRSDEPVSEQEEEDPQGDIPR